jgi:copper resistance protein C
VTHFRSFRAALTASAAVVLAFGMALVGAAAPASAHDQLLSSDPAPGASLDALPAELVLTFNAELLGDGGGNEMQVTDAAGTSLADGPAVVDGTRLVQTLTPAAADGEVTVLWRAVSSDGHPISGEFAFSVTGSADAPEPTMTTMDTPTPAVTATDAVGPAPTSSEATATDGQDGESAASPLPWIILGAVVLLALAAVVFLLASRSRGGAGGTGGDGSTPPAGR